MKSLESTGRLAGLYYLLTVITSGFYLGFVRAKLIDFADPAETAKRLMNHESLFRMGIFSNIVGQVFYLLLGITLYFLFKEVDKTWSTILLTMFIVVGALAAMNTVTNFGALTVLSKAKYLNTFDEDKLSAITMIFLRLNNFGQGILEVFWTPLNLAFGVLILKSRYIPKVLGYLYVIASFIFLFNTFTALAVPQFHSPTYTQLAMAAGGLSGLPTMFWLLIKGAKAPAPA